MAADFPISLCPASQRQVFSKNMSRPCITTMNCLMCTIRAWAWDGVKVFSQRDFTTGDGQWSSWHLKCHEPWDTSHVQWVPAHIWQLMSQLGGSLGPEEFTGIKIRINLIMVPWPSHLCSETLHFCNTKTGVFCSLWAFKMVWKLYFEITIFSGENSLLTQGCFCQHNCQLLFQANL